MEKRIQAQGYDEQIKLILHNIENGYSSEEDISHNPQKKLKKNQANKRAQEIFATSSIDEKEREKGKSLDFSEFTQRRNNDLIETVIKYEKNRELMVKEIMKPISKDEKKSCEDLLDKCQEDCQDIVKTFHDRYNNECFLLSKHFVRLKPKGSLWDETLNGFMILLENVDLALCRQNPSRRKSFFFCSEFFKSLVYKII